MVKVCTVAASVAACTVAAGAVTSAADPGLSGP